MCSWRRERQARDPRAYGSTKGCRRTTGSGSRIPAKNVGRAKLLEALIAYLVAVAAAAVLAWGAARRGLPVSTAIARALLALYLGWLLAATLFPIPLHAHAGDAGLSAAANHPNIVPLAGIRETLDAAGTWPRVRLLAGNVLVFVPFGLLLPVAWSRFATVRRVLLAGLALSLGIELAQLGISLLVGTWYRMSDVDDVLLNVLGVGIGWLVLRQTARPLTARRRSTGTSRPRGVDTR